MYIFSEPESTEYRNIFRLIAWAIFGKTFKANVVTLKAECSDTWLSLGNSPKYFNIYSKKKKKGAGWASDWGESKLQKLLKVLTILQIMALQRMVALPVHTGLSTCAEQLTYRLTHEEMF